jgi:multicomponent K+:H+ antiporter subunit A
LAAVFALYAARRRLFALHERLPFSPDAAALYHGIEDALIRAARILPLAMDNGSLQRSMALLLSAASLAMLLPLADGGIRGTIPSTPVDALTLLGALLLMGASLLVVLWHEHRLSAVIALSVVGLLVALVFVRFSAPDLALTQLCVEVVTIMLLLLALFFLPQRHGRLTRTSARMRRHPPGLGHGSRVRTSGLGHADPPP